MEEIDVELGNIQSTGRFYDKIDCRPTKTSICLPHTCDITSDIPSPISEWDEVK